MTKLAKVFYVKMTNAERDELNADKRGWASPIGQRYLNAKDGLTVVPAGYEDTHDAFELAATVRCHAMVDAEHIWCALQNHDTPWPKKDHIERHCEFPRSMDVGDFIVWPDGTRERCASVGIENL